MKISKHFDRSELACKCGGCTQDTVDVVLIGYLEQVREHFNQPVTITSGNRCIWHNERVGGTGSSQHLFGRAADIIVRGTDPEDVANFLEDIVEGGLGRYPTFTHLDSRNGKARWSGA